jgi:membrane peptidoglycan carboxypeptidase
MYTGMQKSINTYFIQLEKLTGLCKPYALARSMGVRLTDPNGNPATRNGAERTPSFTLGIASVSPLEMAEAYGTIAARGKHCDAMPVTEIDDANGTTLKTYSPQCQQVLPSWTADAVSDILRGVQEPGGFGYQLGHTELSKNGVTIPSAGKTGTTNQDAAVWFDGYTPQIATIAMIAGANSVGHPDSLDNKYVGGHYTAYNASGSGFAGPMWADAMHAIQNTLDPINFHPIDPTALGGVPTPVPSIAGGMNVADARRIIEQAGFHAVVGPQVSSGYAQGTVAYISPSGTAASGSIITIYPSSGYVPPAPQPKTTHSGNGGTTGHSGGGNGHGGGNGGGHGGGPAQHRRG